MKRNFALVLACLIVCCSTMVRAQTPGPARSISLSVDRTVIVAGEQIQVRARTRDANGLARPLEADTWASSNPSVIAVDPSGVATGVGLGVATISATLSGIRGAITMQVVPLRVDVHAPRAKMFIGEEIQLEAAALDVNSAPINGVAFRWDLSGANGGITRAATISNTGLLRAAANALVTAKATVVYTGVQANQVSEYSGLTHVSIEPKIDFKVTRVLANGSMERTFKIQPTYMNMGGNELGQIAFVASLDGFSSGLAVYDAGKISVLATAGSPGPLPGTFIWGFQNPAINNKGQALVRVVCAGGWPNSGLMVASQDGASYVFIEGQSVGNMQRLTNVNITRYSINDKGDILFRADFQDLAAKTSRSGLFKIVDGYLQVVDTNDTPLPGLGTNYSFGFFGLAQDGTVFFVANDGTRSGLYRLDESLEPFKVIATSDSLANIKVTSFVNWTGFGISSSGTVAFNVNFADGTSGIARLRAGESRLELKVMPYGASDAFSIAPNGDVVFNGGDENGWGLHLWTGDRASILVKPVLINNNLADIGNVWAFYDAFITRTGEVYAHLLTADNDLVVVRASGPTVAFKAGAALKLTANFNFLNLIPGARGDAPPDVSAGGQDASIVQWNNPNLIPLYTTGQRTVSDMSSWGLSNAARNAAGDLYFTTSAGIFRNVGGKIETLQRSQAGVQFDAHSPVYKLQWFQGYYNGSNTFAVNSKGVTASLAQSDRGTVVLYTDATGTKILATWGGIDPTPSPAGGFFNGFIWGAALAIDETNRVMFGGYDRNGRQGLFIYDQGRWQTAALANTTRIDGQMITNVSFLQGVNKKLYAQFGLSGGILVIAEYGDDGSWKSLIETGDIMPNGSDVNFIWSRFDVNRNGDIAFLVNMNSGQAIVVRTTDGNNHFVYLTSDPEIDDNRLVQFGNTSFDLRDDGRLYFTAIDTLDRHVLLLAEPLF